VSRPHDAGRGRGPGHRPRPPREEPRHARIPLNADGVPAATPAAPKPSPVVLVQHESRARYPWLPARVIAGSVWRGPANERVRVDERGAAVP